MLLGRHRHRWEGNIRVDLREIGWEGVDMIHLSQDRGQWWAVNKDWYVKESVYTLFISCSWN
jgi:hypothetical protein